MRHIERLGLMRKTAFVLLLLCVGAEPFQNRQAEMARKKHEASLKKAEADYFQAASNARLQYFKDLSDAAKKDQDEKVQAVMTELNDDIPLPKKHLSEHPRDAVKFGKHWYKLFEENITWQRAKKKCEEQGGYLVSINDAEEITYIDELVQTSLNDDPGTDDDPGTGGTQELCDKLYWSLCDANYNVLGV